MSDGSTGAGEPSMTDPERRKPVLPQIIPWLTIMVIWSSSAGMAIAVMALVPEEAWSLTVIILAATAVATAVIAD